MNKRKNYVWVVEMLNTVVPVSRWEPTVGCRLTREDARAELAEWRRKNFSDKFRLRKYAAAVALLLAVMVAGCCYCSFDPQTGHLVRSHGLVHPCKCAATGVPCEVQP